MCSLGAVVSVVVDVDSSCDATDNEWDPSRDQIEPGKEWVLGVRGGTRERNQVLRALDSEPPSHLLSLLNSVRIFLPWMQSAYQGRSLGDLAKTYSKGQRPDLSLTPSAEFEGFQVPCSVSTT